VQIALWGLMQTPVLTNTKFICMRSESRAKENTKLEALCVQHVTGQGFCPALVLCGGGEG
jgi:hypothetical protein